MADKTQSLADRINDALPQTFCRQCGFAGCREYAEAVAAGLAPINRCPQAAMRAFMRFLLSRISPISLLTLSTDASFPLLLPGSAVTNALAAAAAARSAR